MTDRETSSGIPANVAPANVVPAVDRPQAETGVTSPARHGALTMLPLLVGYVPFALVIGSTVADHPQPLAGWAGSWIIFGGSAHLAAIRTLDEAGAVAAILTALLIHARLVVYSTSMARHWAGQPRWFRLTAAALIIDPTWAVAEQHAATSTDARERRHFFLGAALTLGAGWSAAMAAGVLLGARLDWLDLQVAVPLCLIALIGGSLRAGGTRLVIAASALTAFLTSGWPSGTGLLAAVAVGCLVGAANDRRRAR
jgi:predicted branched-subunit amino acid permease